MTTITMNQLTTLSLADCWHDFGDHFKKLKRWDTKKWQKFVIDNVNGTLPTKVATSEGIERLGTSQSNVEDFVFEQLTGRNIKEIQKQMLTTEKGSLITFGEGEPLLPNITFANDEYVAYPLSTIPEGLNKDLHNGLIQSDDHYWMKFENGSAESLTRRENKRKSAFDFNDILPHKNLLFVVDTTTPIITEAIKKSSDERKGGLFWTQTHETLYDPAPKWTPGGEHKDLLFSPPSAAADEGGGGVVERPSDKITFSL